MIFPRFLPGESLAGWWCRTARWNGLADCCDYLFGQERSASFISSRVNLRAFSVHTSSLLGSAIEVFNSTVLGARYLLSELDHKEVARLLSGEECPALTDLEFAGRIDLKCCPACVRDDQTAMGFSYWRRLHQIPVVWYCIKHERLLQRFEIKRHLLHKMIPPPGDLIAEFGESTGFSQNAPFYRLVAGVAEEVLPQTGISTAVPVRSCLISRLAECHGIRPNGKIIREQVERIVLSRLPRESTQALLQRDVLSRLIRCLDVPSCFPFGYLIWISLLYGSWKSLNEAALWVDVFGCSEGHLKKDKIDTIVDANMHHRKVCSSFFEKNPDASRLDFTRAEYRSFRWLIHHDRRWIDSYIPSPVGRSIQLSLFEE